MSSPSIPFSKNNPNPQTKNVKDIDKKQNTKKETKILEVDQKTKDTKTRMQGNTRDRIREIIESAIREENSTNFTNILNQLCKDLYDFDYQKTKTALGVEQKQFYAIINYITSSIKTKDELLSKLDKYFLELT
jgi:hypothetical protein